MNSYYIYYSYLLDMYSQKKGLEEVEAARRRAEVMKKRDEERRRRYEEVQCLI